MEILFLIIGVIVILFAINSLKKKTISRLNDLEEEINRLQMMFSESKSQAQPENMTEKTEIKEEPVVPVLSVVQLPPYQQAEVAAAPVTTKNVV